MKNASSNLTGLVAAMLLAASAGADTVKLKDGTTLEGLVLEENATQVVIRVEIAGGTISRHETLNRADIAGIVRLTPEEKARLEMERQHQKIKRYQLKPTGNYRAEYYDQVITNVFLRFLARYPDSPHKGEVIETIAQWQAEREKVAAGQVKYAGQWMEPQQAAQSSAVAHDQNQLNQAKQLAGASKFDQAVQQFRALGEKSSDPAVAAEAKQLETQTYQQWLADCQQSRRQIAEEMRAARTQLAQAKKNDAAAEKLGKKATSSGKKQKMGASSSEFLQDQAEKQVKEAEARMNELTEQQNKLDEQIAEIRTHLPAARGGSKAEE
jgi:hypothetical protein